MKKIIGVVIGVSFLSAMAHTAFAVDPLNSTSGTIDSISTTTSTNTTTSTADTTTTTTSTQSTAPTTATLQPELTLEEGADNIITGTEKVYIGTHRDSRYIQYVSVSLRTTDSLSSTVLDRTIGQAKIDPASNKWVFPWDSTLKPNGVYILSALVVATNGEVVRSNEINVTVRNETTIINTATAPTTQTTSTQLTTTTVSEPLETRITLKGGLTTVVGGTEVYVKASKPVSDVYVGLIRSDGSERHIGKASFDIVNSRWVYPWDSTNTPDGSYKLFATVMSDGKSIRTSTVPIAVKNVVAQTTTTNVTTSTATEEYLNKITENTQKRADEVTKELATTVSQSAVQKESTQSAPAQTVLPKTGIVGTFTRPSKSVVVDYEKVINEKSQDLADALEKGDMTKRQEVIAEIVRIARGGEASTSGASDPLVQKVEDGVRKLEQVIIEQERGVVDETIFKVESVKVAEIATRPDGTQNASKIEFRGKALPNSFVTVYIFSIPIVVTVKADSEGNWNYTLDKELEDGNHQVYVGITDVKGKVVVKSNPVPFVKTASAISVEEALAVPQAQAAPSLAEGSSFYGIVTIIILILISVFVFLGFKMSKTSE